MRRIIQNDCDSRSFVFPCHLLLLSASITLEDCKSNYDHFRRLSSVICQGEKLWESQEFLNAQKKYVIENITLSYRFLPNKRHLYKK